MLKNDVEGGEERVPAPQRLSTLTQKVFDNFQKKVLVGRWRQTIKEAPGWNTWRSWLDISALLWRGEEELQLIVLQRVYCFFLDPEEAEGGERVDMEGDRRGTHWHETVRETVRDLFNRSLNSFGL